MTRENDLRAGAAAANSNLALRLTTRPTCCKRTRNLWRTTTCSLARRMRIGLSALLQSSRGLAAGSPPLTRGGVVLGRLWRGQRAAQALDRRHQDRPEGLLEEKGIGAAGRRRLAIGVFVVHGY